MPDVLLPGNRTVIEEALAVSTDPAPGLLVNIEALRGFRYQRPLIASVAPWLVQEYGLGPISQFFDTVEALIDEGRPWQRLRGTPAAIATALGWIGYGAISLEDQLQRRRRWHLYQIGMGKLPGAAELTTLNNAEYLAGLSDPARSEFFRGWHGYDVRGLTWGNSRYGRALWGDASGVRLTGGKVKWSHGRSHTIVASAVISDWSIFGLDPALETGDGAWSNTLAWSTPGLGWGGIADVRALKTWLLLQKSAHIGFYDAGGAPIGFARVIREPKDVSGASPSIKLAFEVQTRFGDGAGATAASVAVVLDLPVVDGVKPYAAWLKPADVDLTTSPIRLGETAWAHTFQKTVRELITITLTIPL